jgi:hypothetical protein
VRKIIFSINYFLFKKLDIVKNSSRDAIKVIRKKMTAYAGKNWAVVMKLLTVYIFIFNFWFNRFFKFNLSSPKHVQIIVQENSKFNWQTRIF